VLQVEVLQLHLSQRADDHLNHTAALHCGPTENSTTSEDANVGVASVFAVALPAHPTLGIAAASVATMVAVSIGWYFLVAYMFTTEPMVRGYRQIGHWIDRLAGGILILLGVKLAMESK